MRLKILKITENKIYTDKHEINIIDEKEGKMFKDNSDWIEIDCIFED